MFTNINILKELSYYCELIQLFETEKNQITTGETGESHFNPTLCGINWLIQFLKGNDMYS